MYMHGLYLPMITVLEIKMKYLIFITCTSIVTKKYFQTFLFHFKELVSSAELWWKTSYVDSLIQLSYI